MTSNLPSIAVMRRAFADKDASFDGLFVVAVKTTGIFCRPTCRAKTPRPQNVEFFATPAQALAHGYRACKLCKPDQDPRVPDVVGRLMDLAHRDASPLRGRDLRTMGIDPGTARRRFRRHVGMSFAAYQRGARMGSALARVRRGANMTDAQLAAGFESASGFREAFGRLFGTPALKADHAVALAATWIPTPLGSMLAAADEHGVALLDFIDRRGLPGAIERLRRRCGAGGQDAVIVPADHPHLRRLRGELDEYFAGRRLTFSVPLSPAGTPFERRAWDYLRTIPPGQTRSYSQQAQAIGAGGGARAVGRANGMNYLSIIIPCHRVVGADGALTGYGGGLWRKRWLLDHERRRIEQSAPSVKMRFSDRVSRS